MKKLMIVAVMVVIVGLATAATPGSIEKTMSRSAGWCERNIRYLWVWNIEQDARITELEARVKALENK